MRVHFMTAVDGNHDDFRKIVQTIEKLGHELISKHYLEREINDIKNETPAESELYAKKANSWIKKADAIIFETSKPDVSVGFEISVALNFQKPVIVLYRKDGANPPYSLVGVNSDKLQVLGYDSTTLSEILELALEYASEANDVRFNFFISPTIGNYLDWIAKEKKIPRSVYLRSLIENDMADNDDYE